eukprot:scaffold259_cov252-Pinguiococcus_pyrenoidosus.AAC.40
MSRETKRFKASVLSLATFDASSAREAYASAEPYAHGVVTELGIPSKVLLDDLSGGSSAQA